MSMSGDMMRDYEEQIETLTEKVREYEEMTNKTKPIGETSIQEQYKQLSVEKSTDKRLDYLIQYHRSLSIQFGGMPSFSRESIKQLKHVEKEIEKLLGIGGA